MKTKLLIVEDDLSIIALLKEALSMSGFDVEILSLGKTAIEKLKEIREGRAEKPDLVLLDIILPDMNGIEILKEARRYPETKDLKIFALTNYSSKEFSEELKKEGIDRILLKAQYSLNEIVDIIKKALE